MNAGRLRFLWLWGPAVAYTAFIFWISSAPRPVPGIQLFPWIDKLYHVVEYGPLGALWTRAFRRSRPALGISIGIGGLDELYQRFIPPRITSGWDLLFDGIGAAVGIWLYRRRI